MDVRHSRFLKSAYRRAVYNPIPGGAVVPKNEHGSPVRVGMAPLMAALNSDEDDDWNDEANSAFFYFHGGIPKAVAGRDLEKDDSRGWTVGGLERGTL